MQNNYYDLAHSYDVIIFYFLRELQKGVWIIKWYLWVLNMQLLETWHSDFN